LSNIKDQENAKTTYNKFLQELLGRYSTFLDLIRYSHNEDILTNVIGLQKLMIEITNIMKAL
jgi:hypothetical protein